MTIAEIAYIVETLKHRFRLSHWKITLAEGALEKCDARIDADTSYDFATLTIDPTQFAKWDRHTANHVIAHELLHLLMRDLDEAVETANSAIPNAAARYMAQARYGHESEGVVDRLATLLVSVGGEA